MDPIEFGSEDAANPGHPVICAVHLAFRTAALFIYLFGSVCAYAKYKKLKFQKNENFKQKNENFKQKNEIVKMTKDENFQKK